MHVTSTDAGALSGSSEASSRNPSFKIKLPTLDVTDFSSANNTNTTNFENDNNEDPELADVMGVLHISPRGSSAGLAKSPTTLTPPHTTPRSASPVGRSPSKSPTPSATSPGGTSVSGHEAKQGNGQQQKHLLQVSNHLLNTINTVWYGDFT